MNIEQANNIALAAIMDKLGIKPAKQSSKESVYLSPLREERTASFNVHHGKNVWYDHGIGEGGTTIDFACAYLKSHNQAHTISDALRWLATIGDLAPYIAPVETNDSNLQDSQLVLKLVKPIEQRTLIDYLTSRGIQLPVARQYLKELRIYNKATRKSFFALGFKNEDEGYEVRNKFFKGCIRPKTVTFIRGTQPKNIHIFEGFMDFLSIITHNKGIRLKDDAIILNSLSCLKQATPYIKDYGYNAAYTWMDNDKAGKTATASLDEFFKTQEQLVHKPMNFVYASHKDINAWHMCRLGLTT